jgi:hypothetical protein
VVLFLAGILLMFQPRFRSLIPLALVGMSVATQILNADTWKPFWEYERQMWWQLTWRAPDIQNDTLVMTYSTDGYNPEQDYEIWGPINLIYRPGFAETPSIQAEVLNDTTVFNILKKEVINNYVRDIKLHRDYNNVLLLSMSPLSSCLHVIDGRLPVYSETESSLIRQAGEYSRIDRIVPTGTAPAPPAAIFGAEPARGWCYYYQKASLARQVGDWEEIAQIYEQVTALGLETNDKSELIPFFEAFVNLGRYDEARALYNKQIKGNPGVRFALCTFLGTKDPGYPAEFRYDYQTIYELLCNS